MNIFVFDIETVPDVQSGRRLLGLEGLDDFAVAEAMLSLAKEATGSAFVKTHLQKIVAISAAFRNNRDEFRLWSLGDEQADEPELIRRFFAGIEKYKPTLVSWNGSGFDLPVLHYRALLHGIPCAQYWDTGDLDNNFKYNNYLNRYHCRHIDVMDVLAGYQGKAFARLDDIATMLGLPGKMGMDGSQVNEFYLRGEREAIRHYCEIDVLNTYLVYLRFQKIRGILSEAQYDFEIKLTKEKLNQTPKPHFLEFLKAWAVNDAKMGV